MEIFPGRISVAVFIAAFMPGPSYSASTLFQEVLYLYISHYQNYVGKKKTTYKHKHVTRKLYIILITNKFPFVCTL
ncbi:unnamed protein product [Linum tenue]|uniref:Secreted protein n=1 Tax=Linum tenue TaxID=586396 RepID=A0AAV0MJQ3_9ROSI|nr:unnamed protein product [Linum tenue]